MRKKYYILDVANYPVTHVLTVVTSLLSKSDFREDESEQFDRNLDSEPSFAHEGPHRQNYSDEYPESFRFIQLLHQIVDLSQEAMFGLCL